MGNLKNTHMNQICKADAPRLVSYIIPHPYAKSQEGA